MITYADDILLFLKNLDLKIPSLSPIKVLNPYQDKTIFSYCKKFYKKYYDSINQRTLIIGINPGRFGGGLTGIPFTDPIKLEKECNIKNNLPKKAEMSGNFIYKVINSYGGLDTFYNHFYFSSISPLGFICNGKNMNYYSTQWLQNKAYPFIVETIKCQIQFGLNPRIAFCLGMDKNFNFFCTLNRRFGFFKKIVPLPHPRFIMQYNIKRVDEYVQSYIKQLTKFNE